MVVFLNAGKGSGQYLSGCLCVILNITYTARGSYSQTYSVWMTQPLFFLWLKQIGVYLDGYQPDGVESLCIIPEACSLYIGILSCTGYVGGEPDTVAKEWDCHSSPCVLFFFPLLFFLYGVDAVGCRWGHCALVMIPPKYWRVLFDNTARTRDTTILGSAVFLGDSG